MDSKIILVILLSIVAVISGASVYMMVSSDNGSGNNSGNDEPELLTVGVTVLCDNYDGLVVRFTDVLPDNTILIVKYDGEKHGEFLLKQVILGVKYTLGPMPGVNWFTMLDGTVTFESEGINYKITREFIPIAITEEAVLSFSEGMCERYNSDPNRLLNGHLMCRIINMDNYKVGFRLIIDGPLSEQEMSLVSDVESSLKNDIFARAMNNFKQSINFEIETEIVDNWISSDALSALHGIEVELKSTIILSKHGGLTHEILGIPDEIHANTVYTGVIDGMGIDLWVEAIHVAYGKFPITVYVYHFETEPLVLSGVVG